MLFFWMCIVLIGAKTITFDYVLDNERYEHFFRTTDSELCLSFDFLPTTTNSLFSIVQKAPFDMIISVHPESHEFTKMKIKQLEMLFEKKESVSLKSYIKNILIRFPNEEKMEYQGANFFFTDDNIAGYEEMLLRLSEIPLNEKEDKEMKIHLVVELISENCRTIYNLYIPFELKVKYGRWFPTV